MENKEDDKLYYVTEKYELDGCPEADEYGITLYSTFEEAREKYLDLIKYHIENLAKKDKYIVPNENDVLKYDCYDCHEYNEYDYSVFRIGAVTIGRYITLSADMF